MTTTRGKPRWQELACLDQAAQRFEDRRIRQEVNQEIFGWMGGDGRVDPKGLTVPELLRLLADRLEATHVHHG